MTTANTPRVWIGCLACYNSGALVGEWFDAIDCPTDMSEWDSQMLPADFETLLDRFEWQLVHAEERHEELWVMDHEYFHGLLTGECSPMHAAELALLLEESGNPEAFSAYASYVGREYATLDGFAEAFCGVYESEADYAQELAEECGLVDGDAQQWPLYCIDWERAWRELDMGGDNYSIPTGNGDFYIFRGA